LQINSKEYLLRISIT